MTRITGEIVIDAPADVVFDFVAEEPGRGGVLNEHQSHGVQHTRHRCGTWSKYR